MEITKRRKEGRVIDGAALAGVSIVKTEISSTIANWTSVVGLGFLEGFRFSEVFLSKGSTWFASKPY